MRSLPARGACGCYYGKIEFAYRNPPGSDSEVITMVILRRHRRAALMRGCSGYFFSDGVKQLLDVGSFFRGSFIFYFAETLIRG